MKTALLLSLAALCGCAAPQIETYTPSQPTIYRPSLADSNVASSRVEVVKRKQREATLRKELAKTQEELEAAKKEIDELTEELRKAEEELKAAEHKADTDNHPSSSGTGEVFTGPRGGRYTISPSGKKVYEKRSK